MWSQSQFRSRTFFSLQFLIHSVLSQGSQDGLPETHVGTLWTFLAMNLCYSQTRCSHWGNGLKGTWELSASAFTTLWILHWCQNKKLNKNQISNWAHRAQCRWTLRGHGGTQSQLPRPVFRPCPGSPLSDLVARGACASLLRRRVPTRSRPPPFTRLGASDPIVRSLPLRGDPLGMSGEASPPRTGSLQAHPDPPRTCPPPR